MSMQPAAVPPVPERGLPASCGSSACCAPSDRRASPLRRTLRPTTDRALMTSSTTAVEGRRRLGVPLVVSSPSGLWVTVIGLARRFEVREIFQSIVVALVVGFFTLGLRRMSETNDELAATRSQLADLAVVNERLRIARDLHDLLGHS